MLTIPCLVLALAAPDLRLVIQEGFGIQPYYFNRWWRTSNEPDSNSSRAGVPHFASIIRNERRGAKELVTIAGVPELRNNDLLTFHPNGLNVLGDAQDRVGVDITVMPFPEYVTRGQLMPAMLRWIKSSGRDHVWTNPPIAMDIPKSLALFSEVTKTGLTQTPSGLKIGVLALTGSNAYVPIVSPFVAAREMVDVLRWNGADLVVAMCLGTAYFPVKECMQLTSLDIDLLVPPGLRDVAPFDQVDVLREVDGTFILPRGLGGFHYPVGTEYYVVDFERRGHRWVPVQARNRDMKQEVPDFQDKRYKEDVEWLAAELKASEANNFDLGNSTTAMPEPDWPNYYCRFDICPLGQFLGQAMQTYLPVADVIIINGGGLRGTGWEAGPVTMRDVVSATPYDNSLCYFNASGPEVWRMVSKFTAKVNRDGSFNETRPHSAGFMQTYNLRYLFDPARPEGENVLSLEVKSDGEWESVRRTRHYTVASLDFLCNGGDDHDWNMVPGTRVDVRSSTKGHDSEQQGYYPAAPGFLAANRLFTSKFPTPSPISRGLPHDPSFRLEVGGVRVVPARLRQEPVAGDRMHPGRHNRRHVGVGSGRVRSVVNRGGHTTRVVPQEQLEDNTTPVSDGGDRGSVPQGGWLPRLIRSR
eukprot:Hpha_TRINITY_DN15036_c1_g10::TRINITY_DN15036_c1_g10_i1::g.123315::m.123315